MPPSARPIGILCACLVAAAASAACSTEDVHPDALLVDLMDGALPPEGRGMLDIYLVRDDVYSQDATPVYRQHPPYRLRADGRLVAWGQDGLYDYVDLFPNTNMYMTQFPAGRHVFELVDDHDQVAATTPPLEVQNGIPLEIVFFGAPAALRQRWMFDDPALIPAGFTHVRLFNALDNHDPIEPVQCSSSGLGGPCVALAGSISYGDLFETDVANDTVDQLAWRWASPLAVDPVSNRMIVRNSGPTSPYLASIPFHILGPANRECPSCGGAFF
jgi:hypothetical protein